MPCSRRNSHFRGGLPALLMAAFLFAPSGAEAAVRWVSPSGSASSTGDQTNPWSLSKANASLVAGDVCMILPGVYSTQINPANGGTPTQRITYVGNLSNPNAAQVASIHLEESYVTVKGVRSVGATTLSLPARYDSVAFSTLSGGLGFWAAKNSMVAHNDIRGNVWFLANGGNPCYSNQTPDAGCFANTEWDTVRANRIDLGIIQPGSRKFQFKAWTQNCLIDSNKVTGTFDNNGSSLSDGGIALISFNSYKQTFRDNRWEFEATSAHHQAGKLWTAFYFRDSLHTTLFERDTLLAGLNSSYAIESIMSGSGTFQNSVRGITLRNCYFKQNASFYWQDGFRDWLIEGCVIATSAGRPIWVPSWTNSKLRHNTLWSNSDVLHIEGGGRFSGTQNEITSNIFYSKNAGPKANYGGVMHVKDATTGFTSNHNVFFAPQHDGNPGDRSLMWSGYYSSRPGRNQPWFNMNGQDGDSRYGSPAFVDSSFLNLDPRLRPGSAAIGAGQGGLDAGAAGVGIAPVDQTPPSAPAVFDTLFTSDDHVELRWNAPGDDGLTGLALAYDLRWSTQPIDEANFFSATPAGVPLPGSPGTQQSTAVSSLTLGTTYYFAIRARDDADNWSALALLSVTTDPLDFDPPEPAQLSFP